jgi:hypothetical protein
MVRLTAGELRFPIQESGKFGGQYKDRRTMYHPTYADHLFCLYLVVDFFTAL